MKKIIVTILLIFLSLKAQASIPAINCADINMQKIEKESIINKFTGVSFVSEKIVEALIAHELNQELNSKVSANIKPFNIKRLINGEFESLYLKGKEIKYKYYSISDFNAATICKYNKVYYSGTRVYYLHDLPFNFTGNITNKDIENALNSDKFQNAISRPIAKVNGVSLITISTPKIEIKDGRIHYILPLKTIIGSLNVKFNSDIAVKNNTIMLTDIKIDFIGPFSVKILYMLSDKVNPFKYELSSIKGKYCKIYVTNAKISDNIINTEGLFIINKNYDGVK